MTVRRVGLRANASLLGGVVLHADVAQVENVDTGRRTISGLVVPYGVPGRTNLGHGLAVRAGAVRFHEPARRVIGVYGHTGLPGQPKPAYPEGAPVARGLVNYDAVELPALLGRSTPELAAELGPGYEREVVHRDDLVLL